jgi:hypothetical protein
VMRRGGADENERDRGCENDELGHLHAHKSKGRPCAGRFRSLWIQ